jgi:hypothetical protein
MAEAEASDKALVANNLMALTSCDAKTTVEETSLLQQAAVTDIPVPARIKSDSDKDQFVKGIQAAQKAAKSETLVEQDVELNEGVPEAASMPLPAGTEKKVSEQDIEAMGDIIQEAKAQTNRLKMTGQAGKYTRRQAEEDAMLQEAEMHYMKKLKSDAAATKLKQVREAPLKQKQSQQLDRLAEQAQHKFKHSQEALVTQVQQAQAKSDEEHKALLDSSKRREVQEMIEQEVVHLATIQTKKDQAKKALEAAMHPKVVEPKKKADPTAQFVLAKVAEDDSPVAPKVSKPEPHGQSRLELLMQYKKRQSQYKRLLKKYARDEQKQFASATAAIQQKALKIKASAQKTIAATTARMKQSVKRFRKRLAAIRTTAH